MQTYELVSPTKKIERTIEAANIIEACQAAGKRVNKELWAEAIGDNAAVWVNLQIPAMCWKLRPVIS